MHGNSVEGPEGRRAKKMRRKKRDVKKKNGGRCKKKGREGNEALSRAGGRYIGPLFSTVF